MVLNYIWIAFFLLAAVCAIIQCFAGNTGVFADIINSTFENSKTAFEISIGLTGVLSLWMGIMKIGEKGGMVNVLSKALSPLFTRLFPDIPKGHPATGHIFMNIAANMLGLDNAATPLGLKAMESMQELNPKKDTATNPMIMFLVLNTSGLTIIPVSIMVYRAQMGAAQPTDVFVPILLATFAATLMGIIVTSLYQRINLLQPVLLSHLAACALAWQPSFGVSPKWTKRRWTWSAPLLPISSSLASSSLSSLLAVTKRVNVYEAFIEGAKDGFTTAVESFLTSWPSSLPSVCSVPVAVWTFSSRASNGRWNSVEGQHRLRYCLAYCTHEATLGSGARGMMVDTMTTYGADSFAGRLACIFQGSTDTTFYILAVYFGSVGIRHTRHAVTCGLLADVAGILQPFSLPTCSSYEKKS